VTKRRSLKGFTFMELLVVLSVGALIFSIGTITYSSAVKSSRDSRRKADLESIRQALELCRSFAGSYPAAVGGAVPSPLSCGSPSQTYMQSTPKDPKTEADYPYSRPTTTTYTVSATLENTSDPSYPTYTVNNP